VRAEPARNRVARLRARAIFIAGKNPGGVDEYYLRQMS